MGTAAVVTGVGVVGGAAAASTAPGDPMADEHERADANREHRCYPPAGCQRAL
jgi:hypothetical protein